MVTNESLTKVVKKILLLEKKLESLIQRIMSREVVCILKDDKRIPSELWNIIFSFVLEYSVILDEKFKEKLESIKEREKKRNNVNHNQKITLENGNEFFLVNREEDVTDEIKSDANCILEDFDEIYGRLLERKERIISISSLFDAYNELLFRNECNSLNETIGEIRPMLLSIINKTDTDNIIFWHYFNVAREVEAL